MASNNSCNECNKYTFSSVQNCYKTNLTWDGRVQKTRDSQQNIHFFPVMDIDLWCSGRAQTTACFTPAKLHNSTSQGLCQHPPREWGRLGQLGTAQGTPKVTEAQSRVWQGHEHTRPRGAHGWAGLWHLTGARTDGTGGWNVPWVGWQRCHGAPKGSQGPDSKSVNAIHWNKNTEMLTSNQFPRLRGIQHKRRSVLIEPQPGTGKAATHISTFGFVTF